MTAGISILTDRWLLVSSHSYCRSQKAVTRATMSKKWQFSFPSSGSRDGPEGRRKVDKVNPGRQILSANSVFRSL